MKNRLKIILFVAMIGLLIGLSIAHFINFGVFNQWEIIALPPNMVAQHLSIQPNPLIIEIETISQNMLSLGLDYNTLTLMARQSPHRLFFYGQCQTDSLLDNYYVALPPGRVVEQWDCRLLLPGDWGITYRLALLEQGEVWYWRASDDVQKVIVYVLWGSFGLFLAFVSFFVYIGFQFLLKTKKDNP